jgi:predicted RND superfamily exporter protein
MKIDKIDLFFARLGLAQIRYRFCILIMLSIFTFFGLSGLLHLKTDDNMEEWFEDSEEIKINSDRFKDLFGNDDSVVVLVEAQDIFDVQVLNAIRELSDDLLENVPYAKKISSITDFSISIGVEGGIEVVNPFKDGIPTDPLELENKKKYIMSRKSLVNRLVSDDCKETVIVLSLYPYEKDKDAQEMFKVGKAAKAVISNPKFENQKYSLKAAGMSYAETEEHEVIGKETVIRITGGFIVVFICLAVFTRSVRAIIIPMIASVCGIGAVLGFEARFGIIADSNLFTLPVLLSLALSIGYSIHLINAFKRYFRKTGSRKRAVVNAVSDTGRPILFTALTTVASFISFMFAGLEPLRWLGYTGGFCVLSVYFYTVILTPVLFSFGKDKKADNLHKNAGFSKTDLMFEKFGARLIKKRIPVLIVLSILIIAFIPGIFMISVNIDYFSVMGEKIPYIQRLSKMAKAKLGSIYSYNAMITFPQGDAFKDPQNMEKLDEYAARIGKLSMTKVSGSKPRVNSVTEIVKETNRVLNGDNPEFYRIPKDKELLSQILFLYEISGGQDLFDFLSEDFSTAALYAEIFAWNGNEIMSNLKDAQSAAKELFDKADVALVGTVAQFAKMNGKIVFAELKSFSISFIVILILMSIIFGSLKTGLIAMIPNAAPVIILGGIMGYAGTPLDMLTMTIMPMILGISVDDTIHFISRIETAALRSKNADDAIMVSFKTIGTTLSMTTIILCAMFAVYTTSPVNMLFRMGIYSIIGLSCALAADYCITPLLIRLKLNGIKK